MQECTSFLKSNVSLQKDLLELRIFIKTALLDIIGGVIDAQDEITSGHIVPNGISELKSVDFEVSDSAEKLQEQKENLESLLLLLELVYLEKVKMNLQIQVN